MQIYFNLKQLHPANRYHSSKYETRHYEQAKLIASNSTDVYARRRLLREFISSRAEVEKAKYWLGRLQEHMGTESSPLATRIDRNFFSRYPPPALTQEIILLLHSLKK
jgi:hypothetical protein